MRDSGSCGAGSNEGEASLPPRKSCRGYSSLRGRSGALLTCSETSVTLYTRPRPSSRARGYSSSANPGTAEAKGSGPERQGLGPCPEGVRRFESGPPHPRPPFRVVARMGRGNGQGPHRFPDPRGPGGGGGAISRAGRHGPSPPVGSKTLDGPGERNPRVGTPAGATWSGRVSEPGSRRPYASGGRPRAVPIGRPGLPRDSSTGTSSRSPGRLGGLAP